MLKTIAFAACVAVAGCAIHDPNDATGRMSREFAKGEKLMNNCYDRQANCSKYYKFKKQWETEMNNLTTFENALANHKARLASGLSV